jgi:hypothetical protein
LLKVALNTINQPNQPTFMNYFLVMAPDIIRSFYMYINFIVIMNNEWIMLIFCLFDGV